MTRDRIVELCRGVIAGIRPADRPGYTFPVDAFAPHEWVVLAIERAVAEAGGIPHPYAPPRCPVCEWTNVGLMNYGLDGKSRWMCHGCAARAIQSNG